MLITAMPLIRHRPAAVHTLVLAILLGGGITALLGGGAEPQAMGRRSDLTGRTEVWNEVIPMAPNPIVGAGFETFWLGPRVDTIRRFFRSFVNEAHDGYIEVYLNLGWLGLLIVLILGHGYGRAVGAFRRDPALGGLLVAYVVTAVSYNVTEAGFRMLDPPWMFLLWSVVAPSRVTTVGKGASESGRELTDPDNPSLSQGCVACDPTANVVEQVVLPLVRT